MKSEQRLDPGTLTSLDNVTITVRRDLDRRPAPAAIGYALRRAQHELAAIGLQLVCRPRHLRVRSAPVASATTSDDDGPVTIATVAPAMDVHVVLEAIRLKVISADDAPRFLAGATLEEAILAAHTKPEHLGPDGRWDPPPPALFTRRHQPPGDEPRP